jgi:hypothetical protein
MNRYLETKMNYYLQNKEKQSAYYKIKYATDDEYKTRILETARQYRKENREKCLMSQNKYREKIRKQKYGYLFRANWNVNIIERPINH